MGYSTNTDDIIDSWISHYQRVEFPSVLNRPVADQPLRLLGLGCQKRSAQEGDIIEK